jgi:hypothetical protein
MVDQNPTKSENSSEMSRACPKATSWCGEVPKVDEAELNQFFQRIIKNLENYKG